MQSSPLPDPVIKAHALQKRFGTIEALRGINLEVKRGELYGLVGPDGAGKSTTIRLLCGILKPDGGTLQVLGYPLPEERRAVRARVGYLSQRFSLYEDLTVTENLFFFAQIHQIKHFKQREEELLAFTGLAPFKDRLAGHLSGGMKQKLALACTLIHAPQLLLLDEPTTGVDPVARRGFWQLLAELRHQEITIVLSTPYLDEAERCTHLSLLMQGRVLDSGTPETIKSRLHGEVIELIVHPVRTAAQLLRAHHFPAVLDIQLFGDRLHVLIEQASENLPSILQYLQTSGITIQSYQKVEPSLENVFILLLRQQQTEASL